MRFVISGANGFVGGALTQGLESRGHTVLRLVRRQPASASERQWKPQSGSMDPQLLAGADVVINFSGENLTAQRWTAEYKQLLLDSRVMPTSALATALASLKSEQPEQCPGLFISTSAVGFYGYEGGGNELTEASPSGQGFLAEVCRQWEAATEPAEAAAVRTVHLRLGVVLAADGGALGKMMDPIKKGLGGRLGSGRQMLSWIANEEILPLVEHLIAHSELSSAVNAVSPNAVSNAQFTELLCKQLGKHMFLPVPPFALRALLGEMADELLLGGQNAVPQKLSASGYRFRWPELATLLAHLLPRK
jgi:uncharacterized protein (TIGR01777 family)